MYHSDSLIKALIILRCIVVYYLFVYILAYTVCLALLGKFLSKILPGTPSFLVLICHVKC